LPTPLQTLWELVDAIGVVSAALNTEKEQMIRFAEKVCHFRKTIDDKLGLKGAKAGAELFGNISDIKKNKVLMINFCKYVEAAAA
jgi:hypothetical protein